MHCRCRRKCCLIRCTKLQAQTSSASSSHKTPSLRANLSTTSASHASSAATRLSHEYSQLCVIEYSSGSRLAACVLIGNNCSRVNLPNVHRLVYVLIFTLYVFLLLLNGVTFGDQMEVGNPMYTTTFSFSFVDPTYFHRSLPLWSGAQRS